MSDEVQKRIFAKNLLKYISISGKSQSEIAKSIKVSPQTMNTWCQSIALPRMGKIQLLADYFRIDKSDLIDEQTEKVVVPSRGVKIPVLGRVAAGIPIEAIENIIDTEEIPEEMARRGEYFGLKVKGTSMQPVICDGDIVIVRKQEDADSDEIVIATVNGDDATCKRLMKYEGGLSLISYNPEFAPMTFTDKQLEEIPVRIIGRVVEERRKF